MDLSILIPARNERWLGRTVEDVLAHRTRRAEVIVVSDGGFPDPPIALPADVRLLIPVQGGGHVEYHGQDVRGIKPAVIGQRAGTNLAAAAARGRYVMKLDAHCSVAQGFDAALIAADEEIGRPDVTQIPAMYNLHAFNWRCQGCGLETYQGPTPTACTACAAKGTPGGPFERRVCWDLKAGGVNGKEVRTEFWRFDDELHFQYWGGGKDKRGESFKGYRHRPEAQGELVDVMSSVGACFFMRKARFAELGGLDEAHGSWGQFGTEIACKSWLSGGRHIVNKRTWFAHLFRTQGGDFGFPYANPQAAVNQARAHSRKLWIEGTWPGAKYPLSWLIEKFAPVPDWTPERLAAIRKQAA